MIMMMRSFARFCGLLLLGSGGAFAHAEDFSFDQMLFAPIRVHLLTASDDNSPLRTKLTREDVERVLRKVNGVWAQAGIGFWLETVQSEPMDTEEPAPEVLPGDSGWLPRHIAAGKQLSGGYNLYYLGRFAVNGIYYPRGIFVKDTARLRQVTGGLDEPLPRVTSHELGHALGLPHRQDTFNLMASGTSAWSLKATEIATARKTAEGSGRFLSGPDLLKRIDAGGPERAGSAILSLENEALAPIKTALATPAPAKVELPAPVKAAPLVPPPATP